MSLLDHPVVSQRYFFPRPTRPTRPVEIEGEAGVLRCWRQGEGGERVLVHFHGNGEVTADYEDIASVWARRWGVDVLFAEYRGYGGSAGQPALVGMFSDLPAIFAATGVAAAQTVVLGRSIGSIYALEAARQLPDLAGVILESGIADVAERLLLRMDPEELGATPASFQAEIARHVDARAKVEGYAGPMLVLHTVHDHLVDVSHGKRLAEWGGARATLRLYERGDHNSILAANAQDYADDVGRFVAAAFQTE